jgi:poly-beta-1,6-N-acetyl-D-glucosamine synthase
METILDLSAKLLSNFILYYALIVCGSYILLAVYSAFEMIHYKKKNSYVDYRSILSSSVAPSISIIAPAYNEENTIVENIRSLLSLYYNNFEVIIVNDGSKDNCLQKMIDAYDLSKVDFAVDIKIPCKEIRGVYKSSNKAFNKLIVVDKANGGKADALNAGINIAQKDIIACIDVDCILEQDALLKMVKPFMEEGEGVKVIATGGVIRIANSCEVEDGRITRIHLPKELIPRMQVLEYFRAFLMGRMAWSRLNGLLLVSGALGFFDKKIVIECGGYNHNTVGEDMELVVRMRRYMHDRKEKYKVVYVPDPLCWTEAPSTFKILSRQRNRWMRGTIETLLTHRKLFFNPKYGMLGMLSFPYWFFFEWMAPIIESLGLIFAVLLTVLGYMSVSYFIILLVAVYTFAIMLSCFSILYEELSYHQYRKKSDVFKLILMAMAEPFFYHPLTVKWSIQGNIDFLTGKKSWGEMTRKGFKKKT